jgi:hypothetical protein
VTILSRFAVTVGDRILKPFFLVRAQLLSPPQFSYARLPSLLEFGGRFTLLCFRIARIPSVFCGLTVLHGSAGERIGTTGCRFGSSSFASLVASLPLDRLSHILPPFFHLVLTPITVRFHWWFSYSFAQDSPRFPHFCFVFWSYCRFAYLGIIEGRTVHAHRMGHWRDV